MTAGGRSGLSPARLELLASMLRAEGIERSPSSTVLPRSDPTLPVPLTFAQSRLWFLESFAGHNSAYVISAGLRVHGEFRLDVFAAACAEVVRRHGSLRTVFFEVDGHPMQQVRADIHADVRTIDLRGLTPDLIPARIAVYEKELVERPFDLATGPPFRVTLVALGPREAAVLLSMHHLVSDRWSMGVLMRELTAVYGALIMGTASGLPDLSVQYADFAAWQQESMPESSWRADLDFWVHRLNGAPQDIGLRTQHRRPTQKSYRGSSVPVLLPAGVVTRLRMLAKAENATLFMVLAAAFTVLLRDLSEGDDIVIGTPVANRTLVEVEPLIGFFVNTLALRIDAGGNPQFRDLLHRVTTVCLDAYDHQTVPFERLVEDLAPERSLARTPIFQVMFSYQNVPFPAWTDGALRVEPMPMESQKAEFDLLLDLFEDGDTVWGRLEYSSDLFDTAGAEAIADLFTACVRAVVAEPDRRVNAFPQLNHEVPLRGRSADLDDIATLLAEQPGVSEAVVTDRGDRPTTTRLVAYLTAATDPTSTAAAPPLRADTLIAAIRDQFADYLMPTAFLLLADLPRGLDGTVDRAALPDIALTHAHVNASFTAPLSDLERSLAGMWQALLGIAQVGTHDNFFELGGHSLLATKLVAHITTTHQVQVPIRVLFDAPTVADLAAWIIAHPADGGAGAGRIPITDRAGGVILSFTQQRLLLKHPVAVEDPYHNVLTAVTLTGPLDEVALQDSLDDIVRRHETLRTRIVAHDDTWIQTTPDIDTDPSWPLDALDLRTHDPATRTRELRAAVEDQAQRSFRLGEEPPLHGTLIAIAPNENVLILVMHHIVTDNWSYGVLVRDLCELYEAHVQGRQPRLPVLAIQYPDFAAWQQHRLAAGDLDEDAGYWRTQLADLPPPLQFAAPGSSDIADATGSTCAFTLDAAAGAALAAIAREGGATLFMVLMAALDLLLSAHSGSDDIVVNFPVAGRERAETADLIGYFVNNLVIRADLTRNPTFRQLVDQIRERTLDAYAHQNFPVWSLDTPEGRPFRIIFNLLNAAIPAQNLYGLQTTPLRLEGSGTYVFDEIVATMTPDDVDLALIMREDNGLLRGMWLYSLDHIDPRAMAVMMRRWTDLIALVTRHPDETVGQLRDRLAHLTETDRGTAAEGTE